MTWPPFTSPWISAYAVGFVAQSLPRYSSWANWTNLLDGLRQSRQSGRPEASTSRGIVRRLSYEQVARLIDRHLGGATITDLAEFFKIHRTTVSLHLKRQGVRVPAILAVCATWFLRSGSWIGPVVTNRPRETVACLTAQRSP